MSKVSLSQIDFGQPEAEHDTLAIQRSFYEAESWKTITSGREVPFVVGRKGSGNLPLPLGWNFSPSKQLIAASFGSFPEISGTFKSEIS